MLSEYTWGRQAVKKRRRELKVTETRPYDLISLSFDIFYQQKLLVSIISTFRYITFQLFFNFLSPLFIARVKSWKVSHGKVGWEVERWTELKRPRSL